MAERYDLANRPAQGATMSRGKPLQEGVRVKLAAGTTWDQLAAMSPADIRDKDLFPKGFYPLPHPHHPEGGMVFPQFEINELQKQEARDLARFDLDFDIPDHFLPEFPAPIYLTTRPDLGDVSQGKLVTIDNYYEIFSGILNPKQLEGLRLLLTPFPQQQFNQTEDRRSERPSRGVACFDCHQNGHTNAWAAFSLEKVHHMTLTRRALVLAGSAGFVGSAISAHADGWSAAAVQPVLQLLDGLLQIMKARPGTAFHCRHDMLAPVIDRVFDLDAILRSSVGLSWSSLPPDQQDQL
jgi:hypothetical protein